MKRLLCTSLLLAGALTTMAALAAGPTPSGSGMRYKWRDAQGSVHFADTLPPEALQVGYDVVNTQGDVVRHVDRPRTPEERRAEALASAQQSAAKKRATDATAADHQLLATYPDESDLARVHKDRMVAIDQTLSNINVSLADQEKGLSDQLAHAATFERDGKPVPATVRAQIETLRKTIAEQHIFISRREEERAELIRRSDAELAHYRELHAKQEQMQAEQR
ncbi:MAG: DUF4124 domain-containing protein [Rudaea sp.]